MVMHADLPSFAENVEGAFLVERRAWAAGVAMEVEIALARLQGLAAGLDPLPAALP
jgi:hypothetical protein